MHTWIGRPKRGLPRGFEGGGGALPGPSCRGGLGLGFSGGALVLFEMPSGSEASARAEAALVSARRRRRNRDEALHTARHGGPGISGRLPEVPSVLPRQARAEELAATDWASHVDEVPVPSGFGHAERTSPVRRCERRRA